MAVCKSAMRCSDVDSSHDHWPSVLMRVFSSIAVWSFTSPRGIGDALADPGRSGPLSGCHCRARGDVPCPAPRGV